eukprot:1230560-Prymnesium_polylepis.1
MPRTYQPTYLPLCAWLSSHRNLPTYLHVAPNSGHVDLPTYLAYLRPRRGPSFGRRGRPSNEESETQKRRRAAADVGAS